MRRSCWVVGVALLPACLMLDARAGDGKKDKDLLQGEWEIVGVIAGGKDVGKDATSDKGMTFKGDKIISKSKNQPDDEVEYKLDESKTPKQIDLIAKKTKVLGLYELKGDNLKIALSANGPDQRPTAFAGDETVVLTLKKKK